MNCPDCHVKLYCYDTRAVGDFGRFRRYICPNCKGRYKSSEDLDTTPTNGWRLGKTNYVLDRLKEE